MVALWRLLDRRGRDLNPAGARRPVHRGRPVPWLTPVTAVGPYWRLIHRGRLADAQRDGLCQVCGLRVGQDAVLVIDADGRAPTSAALHPDGAATATTHCPAVARAGTVRPLADGRLHRDGEIVPELGMTQRWRLTETVDDDRNPPTSASGLRPEPLGSDVTVTGQSARPATAPAALLPATPAGT
ncbi:hypothetical protein [Nocardia takedensis]|uniref:hypothetical protein n=1 Tax=Nocardia takedensis TaxID=259390 RepID=UPI0002DC3C8E|nr:hypothetical protein [Nocardia takedensis]